MIDKDWTGNAQAVKATLNASNLTDKERPNLDFYATPPSATEKLLVVENFSDVWEPACGQGHISEVLVKYGLHSRSTDLVDRGYGDVCDFLKTEDSWDGDLITNPPFSKSSEFLLKAMSILKPGRKLAMLLRIQFLEGVKRRKIFVQYPPKYMYVFSRNIRCARNGDFDNATGNASTYCWFIWEQGFAGETTVRWM